MITCTTEIAKLRNIYKPIEVKILTDEDFARELGITPDELPNIEEADDDEANDD